MTSAHLGNNADLIRETVRLYVADGATVLDVTFARGAFWRKTDLTRFKLFASDIDPGMKKHADKMGVPFTALDFRDLTSHYIRADVIVLDPPYIHSPGNHQTDARYNNAATTKGLYHDDIMDLYREGMVESWRILNDGGTLWVKCKDQVMSGRQCWSHIDLFKIAERIGFYARDLFVLMPTSTTSNNRWNSQHHARKTHSYLWIFQKEAPKNGKAKRTTSTDPTGPAAVEPSALLRRHWSVHLRVAEDE